VIRCILWLSVGQREHIHAHFPENIYLLIVQAAC
jgi:hypothetical protein